MAILSLFIDNRCIATANASEVASVDENHHYDAQLNSEQSTEGYAFTIFFKNGRSPVLFFAKTDFEREEFSSKIEKFLSRIDDNISIKLNGKLNHHFK